MSNIITITFTDSDVRSMAEATDTPYDVALERALEWGRYIEETATALCSEQLSSVIETGQP